jgi:alkylated DNA repair dioxygenase AlkB
VRPYGGGSSLTITYGGGDLLVMGGTMQHTFEHCVPKTKHADPRLAIMFRHTDPISGPARAV